MSGFDETWLDDEGNEWADCWQCGGDGEIEGECVCMDDTCCLEPTPPECDICKGDGVLRVRRK